MSKRRKSSDDVTPHKAPHARRELQQRLVKAESTLRGLGYNAEIWRKLLPFILWTRDGAAIDPPVSTVEELEKQLGPRFQPLDKPIEPATEDEFQHERAIQIEKEVNPELAGAVAEVVIMQRRMVEQGRSAMFERETPAWEAATEAAVAAAAMADPKPEVLAAADGYFERLESAREFGSVRETRDTLQVDLAEKNREERARRSAGGHATKLRMGIYAATIEILRKEPSLSARKVWERIPDLDEAPARPLQAANYEVYRASQVVSQANGPAPDAAIKFPSFRKYVARAKEELRRK